MARKSPAAELEADFGAVCYKLKEKETSGHPGKFGMPDLLFPKGYRQGRPEVGPSGPTGPKRPGEEFQDGWFRAPLAEPETDEAYEKRQNAALHAFLVDYLFIVKDAHKLKLVVISPMLGFIGDVFYGRTKKSILWKPRGGGGSLSAGILTFLLLVYRKISVVVFGGSDVQSKIIYSYVTSFWDCIPGLRAGVVDGDPRVSETMLKTGAVFNSRPATDKQARGQHVGCVIIDEACVSSSGGTELAMRAALQGAISETDPIIVLLSTFHLPMGFFQEYWDNSVDKGFKRYTWSCFDTMCKCSRGLETATPEDPMAIKYCDSQCFLTYIKKEVSEKGEYEAAGLAGCRGKARTSTGWATYDSLCEAKKMNIGTRIFECEFANERPGFEGNIYDPEMVDKSLSDELGAEGVLGAAVGIDWGIETENSLCITLLLRKASFLYLAETIYMDHKLVADVAQILFQWRKTLGDFPVLPDASHPFNNAELAQLGYDVRPVGFGAWKKVGIQNLAKYFTFRRLRVNRNLERMIQQLKMYRTNAAGSIIKRNDHGPDSLLCAALNWRFEDEFGPDMDEMAVTVKEEKKDAPKKYFVDGIMAPRAQHVVPQESLEDRAKRQVLMF